MKKKILIIGAVVVVVIILIIANLATSNEKTIDINVIKAGKKDMTEIVSASGRIQPQTKVNITSEVNGEIIKLLVKEGDVVRAGDLLVMLDTVQLASDAEQAHYAVNEINARLEGAKSTLDQSREEFERQEQLYKNNLTSETQSKNANYAYLNAKAAYEAMLAQAKQLESRNQKQLDYLSKTKIRAPMSGIITYLDCEVGEIAAAQTSFTQGKTLMTISNLNVFEVEVEVDETEISKIELNQPAKISVDAFPDSVFSGEVVEIGNTAIYASSVSQDQSTNFRVKVIFKETKANIRPGMSADVDITTNKQSGVIAVPFSAVVMRSLDLDSLERARQTKESTGSAVVSQVQAAENVTDEETPEKDTLADSTGKEVKREDVKGVYIIRNGLAEFVPVKTGIADQKDIEILSGINDSDSVISGPYRILRTIKDGDRVKVIKQVEETGRN
ncbi:MAG: efflux RND transporter periplasmic adaptor subunit [candidate division Zixibacteria bacterium]|nr:efflux RND transporter periplasmic adaptor subunit [candidate division Zixibacteria bacterium]MDD5426246.1 efflux RND transporter periplasmic adaptor subunit [candidate division Zixibacteria bacterium]